MSLDVYVKPYIPAWLLRVNESPAQSVSVLDDPNKPEQYTASFSGTDVWIDSLSGPASANGSHPKSILQERIAHLQHLLALEDTACRDQARSWSRFEVLVSSYSEPTFTATTPDRDHASPSTRLYTCQISGLAEYLPRALIHDPVELRQLVPQQQSFDGYVLHARVKGVRRAKGQLILESPVIHFHSGTFNVSFPHDEKSFKAQNETLKCIAKENTVWMISHCFPERKHCKLKTQLTRLRKFAWKDQHLNLEQMKAVQEIYEQRYGDMVYLIQGPPGTGKTKTLVEAILQIYELNPEARIIACGASNTAADTLALRLIKHIHNPKILLRMNSHARSFEEVPEPLLPFSCIEHDGFIMPTFKVLMSKRIIVATIAELMQLNKVKCDNQSVAKLERYTMSSLYPDRVHREPHIHFSHLFLDEAAQATESESLCVLRIVEPSPGQRVSVVFAGDHKQLGPRVVSDDARSAGFDCSLFQRLIDRPCYTNHPLSRKNILKDPRPQLPLLYPAFTNLYRNYRSHPGILMVPSELSYNSSLMACASNVDSLSHALGLRFPVMFIGHTGEDSAADIDNISSWFNLNEIRIIVDKVKSVLDSAKGLLLPEHIAILAPFREQIVRLRLALRRVGLASVGVGSVEDYQGAEARVIVVSTVRTRDRFLSSDIKSSVGLMQERRRMNVAITRAKELLIVVGNPWMMQQDEHWATWLAFCRRNGTFYGAKVEGDGHNALRPTSSMEGAYQFSGQDFPSLGEKRARNVPDHYSDEAMLLAGNAAQFVLDDSDY